MSDKKVKSKFKQGGAGKQRFKAPRGMHDVLPQDQPHWERIAAVASEMARLYNFGKLDTPVLEFAELFRKTEGEESDVASKEMYILKTKGGDTMALRPEFTPPKARAYLEHSLSRLGQPQKLWSMGPLFRHDRPQLGRLRQFTQIDFDILGGVNDPIYDAEVILLLSRIISTIKIEEAILHINSIGCRICRPIYEKQLAEFYGSRKRSLCEDCLRRLETQPLRLLDCKNEKCGEIRGNAPNFLDKICVTCSAHFKEVLGCLDELEIPYRLNHQLVRGFDYYNRTVFEFLVEGKGSEVGSIGGGGRYDYLMELLGGHLTPAVGGSLGVERLIWVMKAQETKLPPRSSRRVFVMHAGETAKRKALKLIAALVADGIPVSESLARDSLKAQLKTADKEETGLALILGQKEIHEGTIIVRDMRKGLQDNVKIDRIVEEIRKRWREK